MKKRATLRASTIRLQFLGAADPRSWWLAERSHSRPIRNSPHVLEQVAALSGVQSCTALENKYEGRVGGSSCGLVVVEAPMRKRRAFCYFDSSRSAVPSPHQPYLPWCGRIYVRVPSSAVDQLHTAPLPTQDESLDFGRRARSELALAEVPVPLASSNPRARVPSCVWPQTRLRRVEPSAVPLSARHWQLWCHGKRKSKYSRLEYSVGRQSAQPRRGPHRRGSLPSRSTPSWSGQWWEELQHNSSLSQGNRRPCLRRGGVGTPDRLFGWLVCGAFRRRFLAGLHEPPR